MSLELVVHAGSDRASINALVDLAVADAVARLGVPVERITCADQPGALADAVGSPSLFSDARLVVANLDGITETEIARIAASASSAAATVIGYGSELNAAVKKRLGAIGTVHSHATPRAKDAGERIVALSELLGLTLDGPARQELTARCGHDLDRASSVMRALASGGYLKPTPAQIRMLAGTSAADGVPWDVTDALERGDLAGAMNAARRCEPIAVVAYLSAKALEVARIAEQPGVDAAELLGVSPWQAKKAEGLARRAGRKGAYTLVASLARADRDVKIAGDAGHDVLDVVLADWVRLTR